MNTRDLDQVYAGWPTEKLVEAVVLRPDEYNSEATALMKHVLDGRGVLQDEIDAIAAGLRSGRTDDRQLGDIAGWLLVFIVWTAVSSTFGIIMGPRMLLGSEHGITAAIGLLVVGASIYGGYCASLLGLRRHDAPAHARRWLISLVVTAVLAAVAEYVRDGDVVSGPGRPIVFSAIWLAYLSRSKRVAQVYGTADSQHAPHRADS